ncbi:hypothetical protein AAF712_010682 [Marasmius tenuissimus]|uniref:Uncharacterized protein n=1 Tax=Marasmius tenuissimus TaxID=585030 RepID=A0ABR2ZMD1_9AGAR
MSAITSIALVTLLFSLFFLLSYLSQQTTKHSSESSPNGYILWNQVTHSRLLPVESAHAFTYPTVALLVSLNSLESGALDLGYGRIFGYGGIHARLLGLRADPYLMISTGKLGGIRGKLVALLEERGFFREAEEFGDAWMLTMPSYLGFEGINPLTVYLCYKAGCDELWLVILEVHNTFGESHTYVLEVGTNEDPLQDSARAGYYTVSVRKTSFPPNAKTRKDGSPPPRPAISVHLHTPSPSGPGPLKLTALLRATHSMPLTTQNIIRTLVRYPLTLLLSLPRILYHAWILHYKKHLDVFIRPEPFAVPVTPPTELISTRAPSGGVRWQPIGLFETFCRQSVHHFVERRVKELGIRVVLRAGDPSTPDVEFGSAAEKSTLMIRFMSPRFYTILVMAPCAELAHLLGARSEKLFEVEEEDVGLLLKLFATGSEGGLTGRSTFTQRLRCWALPEKLRQATSGEIPRAHFIDSEWRWSTVVVGLVLILGFLEKSIFSMMNARVVPGDAPWEEWERAEEVYLSEGHYSKQKVVGSNWRGGPVGSVVGRHTSKSSRI